MKTFRFIIVSLILLALLLTTAAIGTYLFINHSLAAQLQEELARRRATGKPVSWREVVPPPVDEAKNFCSLPLLKDSDENPQPVEEKGRSGPQQIYAGKINDLLNSLAAEKGELQLSSSQRASKIDLNLWSAALKKDKKFPLPDENLPAAESVLKSLSLFDNSFQQLREAVRKPEARFDLDYNKEPKTLVVFAHIGTCMGLSRLICLRASALLEAGRPQEAWEDLKILQKFHQALSQEPSLISSLVDLSIQNQALGVIWQGLNDRSWTDAQLKEISATLRQFDGVRYYRKNIEGEWFFCQISLIEYIKKNPSELATAISEFGDGGRIALRSYFTLFPKGEFDRTQLFSLQLLEENILPAASVEERRFFPDEAKKTEARLLARSKYTPGNIILLLTVPSTESAVKKFGEIQADIDMAILACELELFRSQNGRYPSTLAEIQVPLPKDIVSGQPYGYRLSPDGRYELWGVGWNKSDEGGPPAMKDNRLDRSQGDWVWRYTPMVSP